MKKLTLIAAGLAVAAATLTGCTPPPSAAAVVEGVRVPVSTVDAGVPAIVMALQETPARAQQVIAFTLAQGEVANVIAARHNLTVSDADISAALATLPSAAALADMEGGEPIIHALIRTNIVVERLGESVFLAEMPSVDVEINPRFGTWDAARGTLVDSSLSTVAPTPQR